MKGELKPGQTSQQPQSQLQQASSTRAPDSAKLSAEAIEEPHHLNGKAESLSSRGQIFDCEGRRRNSKLRGTVKDKMDLKRSVKNMKINPSERREIKVKA